MKSNSSKYSEATRRFLLVERDTPLYQYTKYTKIPIYQYKLYSNWWQGNALTRQTFAVYKTNLHTTYSQFFSVSFFRNTRNKKYTLNKIKLNSMFYIVFPFVFPLLCSLCGTISIYTSHLSYIYNRTFSIFSYLMSCCLLHSEIYL